MSEEFEKDYQVIIKAEKKLTVCYIATTIILVALACIWGNIYF